MRVFIACQFEDKLKTSSVTAGWFKVVVGAGAAKIGLEVGGTGVEISGSASLVEAEVSAIAVSAWLKTAVDTELESATGKALQAVISKRRSKKIVVTFVMALCAPEMERHTYYI